MPTTKLRAPDNFGGLSIEGRSVEVGKDGSLHADHRDIATLRSHGFTDWHDHPGADGDIETMTKPQLVEAILARTRAEAEKRDEDELRNALRVVRGEPEPDDGAADDPVEVMTEERINAMPRKDLFAYLAANHVAIGTATRDEGLRAAALDTFRKTKVAA